LLQALERDADGLLQELLRNLHICARKHFLTAGVSSRASRKELEGVNELCLVVATQLNSLREERLAYPNGAFVAVLEDKASSFGGFGDLAWSASTALERLEVAQGLPVVVPGVVGLREFSDLDILRGISGMVLRDATLVMNDTPPILMERGAVYAVVLDFAGMPLHVAALGDGLKVAAGNDLGGWWNERPTKPALQGFVGQVLVGVDLAWERVDAPLGAADVLLGVRLVFPSGGVVVLPDRIELGEEHGSESCLRVAADAALADSFIRSRGSVWEPVGGGL
jgi:hypothetical protein